MVDSNTGPAEAPHTAEVPCCTNVFAFAPLYQLAAAHAASLHTPSQAAALVQASLH
jgi:hypothetical protein